MAKTPIRRRAPIRPIKPNDAAERFYRAQLRGIVRQMAQAVDEALIPVLRRNYTADSYFTDILKEAIRQASERFMNTAFQRNAERLSQRVVSRAESDSSEAFVEQINRAIGIDMTALMINDNLVDYIDASIESNVALIKSLSSDYFDDIQMQTFEGFLRGDSLTTIIRNIQQSTGAAYNRANLIARDQSAKLQADFTSARQQNAGIDRFRWSTSQDVRVSGNPAGKYPLAKISCFAISRIDVGMGTGVYLWSRGAKYNGQTDLFPGRAHIGCRCNAIPQIKGLDY
ncbi:phage head morphogenesis protein [Pectobacterium polaris]|uniref:phage head morphogenesis protein n=1 Tax=Pectobacterium polaris TaxID=2042057 RepID=UPI001CF2D8CD|nr:phage head morphogenesis protein [Pectobacterium polaris]MCA6941336.1 phage head morphogenesis protein [Pectobacterium polaris]MCA6956390.1 phage head morphogenesis protein [Pectobacterium polaris]